MNTEFISVAIWNFLGFGNTGTKIKFNVGRFTAILGENLDDGGGEEGARNGCGKSSIIDAIFYAIYGKTLRGVTGKKIIHKFARANQSTMVEFVFRKGDMEYLIERGENPSRLFFLGKSVNDPDDIRTRDGKAFKFDLTKSKQDTTRQIVETLGLDFLMSKYLWGNSTASKAFLELEAAEKRDIIEKLFGFTVLKERSETLKTQRKELNRVLVEKQAELAANESANRRIHDQIEGLEKKSSEWIQYEASLKKQNEQRLQRILEQRPDLTTMHAEYRELVDGSIELFEDNSFFQLCNQDGQFQLDQPDSQTRAMTLFEGIEGRVTEYRFERGKHERVIQNATRAEQAAKDSHVQALEGYRKAKTRLETNIADLKRDSAEREKRVPELQNRLAHYADHTEVGKCPTCNQDWTDTAKRDAEIATTQRTLDGLESAIADSRVRLAQYEKDLSEMTEPLPGEVTTDTSLSQSQILALTKKIDFEEAAKIAAEPVIEVLDVITQLTVQINEAQSTIDKLDREAAVVRSELEQRKTLTDPYPEQIESLKTSALVDLGDLRREVGEMDLDVEHYNFLIEALTKPDSFLRKKIVEKWLLKVNHKLHMYAKEFGLSQDVRFDAEMEMFISKRDKEYALGNLSRGEQTRLAFAINFAFQDCFESMYFRINVLFLDELLDNGLDPKGASQLMEVIKKRTRKYKHVFLITHRMDLLDQIGDVMLVRKQNDVSEIVWT